MSGKKKHEGDDPSHIKHKKHKKSHDGVDQALEAEDTTFETAELLDAETLREGMLLLGCVAEVKPNFLEICLPGFLSGRVPFNNISSPFTKNLRHFDANTEMEEPTLSFVKIGMIFPCKVIEISQESSKKKSIVLSINPADINADLKPSLLYPKMVLYVSVCSIEDHGYVVDVGNKYIKGFIPKQYSQDEFKIGEVIPTTIKEIFSDKTSARIQLSPLDFKNPFPTVSVEDVNLTSILPGARILGEVIDIKFPFIYIKYLCFNACASSLSFGPGDFPPVKIGKQVCGIVLYVSPITHMIYLSLTLPYRDIYPELSESKYFGLRKYACIKNLKYVYSYKKYAYYVIKKCRLGFYYVSNTLGVFHIEDLPKSASNKIVSKACVLNYHYMDNLVQLSAKPSLLEKDAIFIEDVQIGHIYEGVISKHVREGMFVRICPGLSGFIQRIHFIHEFILSKPEIFYPVGSKIKCRVLYTDGKSKLNLTCKESMMKLQDHYMLTSYENVQKGQFYKGVIAQQTDDYILVLFFNDIKGIVPSSNIPKGFVFVEGQTVLCEVIYCNSSRKELRFSLETQERLSIEEIDDSWDEPAEYFVNGRSKNISDSRYLVNHEEKVHNDIDSDNIISIRNSNMDDSSLEESLSSEIKFGAPAVKTVSLLEKDVIFIEDVQIGHIYEGVISKHVREGMFVRICPGLSGFIQRIHFFHEFIPSKPEIFYPVGSKIKCRVLYTDGKSKLNLTCKESMLKLQDHYMLTSYENVQKGQFYKGVIAQQTDDYILVLFFNDIKGIVPSSNIPKVFMFFEGQTVLCEVIYCNSSRKELRFSLETQERLYTEEIDDSWDEPAENIVNGRSKNISDSRYLVNHEEKVHNDIDSDNIISIRNSNMDDSSSYESLSSEIKFGPPAVKAVITSIKGNQMNIMFDNTIGRVHITELGCTSEDIYPLKDFSVGQEIEVYVIEDIVLFKKEKNSLPVSHQNFRACKECSLRFSLYPITPDYFPGKSVMGFVKEVHDVSVLLWLSPRQIGVLDYLHFSENLKTIKSLHRRFKVGLSLKLSVLEKIGSTVAVTKIDKIVPQLGRNIIGLVQIPCSEHGLSLKLPFGYHGSVAVTDLTDMYDEVPLLFQKYCKSEFLTCHVLEVNHQTKYCQLSLRKSRIYRKLTVPKDNFCPEITKDDLKVGNTMKGFVKSVSNSVITVNLGRNLEGKIELHACSSANCRLCEISKSCIHTYPIGSIVEVVVKEYFKDGRSCILDFIVSGD